MSPHNLFAGIPGRLSEEMVEVLASGSNVRIERIVSRGHRSPGAFWYEQDEHEWVAVVAGAARLRFDDGTPDVQLGPGDHLLLPAHQRHRVEWTDPERDTIWIAVFFGGDLSEPAPG